MDFLLNLVNVKRVSFLVFLLIIKNGYLIIIWCSFNDVLIMCRNRVSRAIGGRVPIFLFIILNPKHDLLSKESLPVQSDTRTTIFQQRTPSDFFPFPRWAGISLFGLGWGNSWFHQRCFRCSNNVYASFSWFRLGISRNYGKIESLIL